MPRFERFQPLYDAFDAFLDRCIRNDRSLIWPEKEVWTLENLLEIKKRFIENPIDDPNISFSEKFRRQIGESVSVIWAMVADIYLVYYFTSGSVTTKTKRNKIQQFAEYLPSALPTDDAPEWRTLKSGLCNTGQFYNQKYRQFVLIILLSIDLKKSENLDEVISDPKKLKSLIDPLMEKYGAYDMRNAIMYLMFPDQFEPIISQRDKKQIIEAFSPDINRALPDIPDDAIFVIREHIQNKFAEIPKPFHFYNDPIKSLWHNRPRPNQPLSESEKIDVIPQTDLIEFNNALTYNQNLILYGPPGSGKTYMAGQLSKEIVKDQLEERPKELIYQQIVEDLTVFDLIALAMFEKEPNGNFSVLEIRQLPLIQSRFRVNPIKNPNQALWGALQVHSNPESTTVNISRRSGQILFDKKEESKWYLIDEGKEYVESTLENYLELLREEPGSSVASDYISYVTFHQSFSYEEFVEGLRPVSDSETSEGMVIEVVPGIFRDICTRASAAPEKQFVLVIDEINRGNISRVFGELITLIEKDKRAGASNQITVKLPYSKEVFSVPSNLAIIGTMNSADRSIALLDTALRRRFAFIEVPADPELLQDKTVSDGNRTIDLKSLLEALNGKIRRHFDKDHEIGHSYLLQVASLPEDERLSAFTYAWNYQILPLLEEYFFSQPDVLKEMLPAFFEGDDDSEVQRSPSLGRFQPDELLITLEEMIRNGKG